MVSYAVRLLYKSILKQKYDVIGVRKTWVGQGSYVVELWLSDYFVIYLDPVKKDKHNE
jgi:hypothetical protein